MALRWVYDNIDKFNGDRDSITLFGPDAGAASAGLLMVNPRTRHMVSKVIAQVTIAQQCYRKLLHCSSSFHILYLHICRVVPQLQTGL